MEIGGLTRFTTQDYPGNLACTIHTQGCNLSCSYCHNPSLILATAGSIEWHEVAAFLRSRIGKLEAVVFSGGEPTIHPMLMERMREARAMGYNTGLHTNGAGQYYTAAARLSDYILLSRPERWKVSIATANAGKVAISHVHKDGDGWVNNIKWVKQ